MNDDMDELDRALFALPLATPPEGLRASILSATVFAPSRTFVAVARPWEMWVGGVALAVAAWLCIAIVAYKGFAAALSTDIDFAVRAFGEPSTLVWFALGFVVTASVWYVGDGNLRLPFRGARS
jgi:hypothetical protein